MRHNVLTCTEPLSGGKKYIAVEFLTKETVFFVTDVKAKSQEIFDEACQFLGLNDVELFGLAIFNEGEYQFLDDNLKLSKCAPKGWKVQTKGIGDDGKPLLKLYFRVKFYVDCYLLISDKVARHHYYLQLCENVINYNLSVSEDRIILLAAYALQADLGSYCINKHANQYFEPKQYFPHWVIKSVGESYIIEHIPAMHKDNSSLSRAEAQVAYLKEASDSTATHNLHLYKMQRKKSKTSIWLGIFIKGIKIYEQENGTNIKNHVSTFYWPDITKLYFEKKKFEIRTAAIPELRRFTYFANNEDIAKNLFWLCKMTHCFHMAVQPRVQELQKLELEEHKLYREAYIYSDSFDLEWEKNQKHNCESAYPVTLKKGEHNKCEQRISVISTTSSTTTSGIVSDKAQGFNESEDDLNEEIIIDSPPLNFSFQKHPEMSTDHLLTDRQLDDSLFYSTSVGSSNKSSVKASNSSLSRSTDVDKDFISENINNDNLSLENTNNFCNFSDSFKTSCFVPGKLERFHSENEINIERESFKPRYNPNSVEVKQCSSLSGINKLILNDNENIRLGLQNSCKLPDLNNARVAASTAVREAKIEKCDTLYDIISLYSSSSSDYKRTTEVKDTLKTESIISSHSNIIQDPSKKVIKNLNTHSAYVQNPHGRTATRIGVSSLNRIHALPLTLYGDRNLTAAGSEPNLCNMNLWKKISNSANSLTGPLKISSVCSQSEISLNCLEKDEHTSKKVSSSTASEISSGTALATGNSPGEYEDLVSGFPCIPPPPAYRNSPDKIFQEDIQAQEHLPYLSTFPTLPPPLPFSQAPQEISPSINDECISEENQPPDTRLKQSNSNLRVLDLQQLREKSKDLNLPLISALCNDRSLLILPKTVPSCSRQRHLRSNRDVRRYSCSYISAPLTSMTQCSADSNNKIGVFQVVRPLSWHLDSLDYMSSNHEFDRCDCQPPVLSSSFSDPSFSEADIQVNKTFAQALLPPTILTSFANSEGISTGINSSVSSQVTKEKLPSVHIAFSNGK